MVILDARSLDLDNSIDHLATTWEVSDDPSFKNVLLESVEDYKNKLSIIFSENLDPDMKYYARARALTAAGWTSWGNVDVFKVRNNTDLTPQDIFPTKVSIPRIRTFRMTTDTGLGYLDPEDIYGKTATNTETLKTKYVAKEAPTTKLNEDKPEWEDDFHVESLLHEIDPSIHDLTLFEIWVDGFEVIGNASLKATSYWIEDTDGNVIWKSLVDNVNRNKIKVQDLILKSDKTYRIRAVFHTNSNDVSQIATYTITTTGCDKIKLISYLDQVPYDKNVDLQLEWVEGINLVKWEILQHSLGIIKSVWKSETTTIVNRIPAGVLSVNSNYLLRIQTNLSDCYKYYPFITSIVGDESPNDPLTPLLVYPTTITIGLNQQAKLLVESVATDITYIADSPYYSFNKESKFLLGTKIGEGVLYVKAKMPHNRENIIEVIVNVVAEEAGGTTDPNNKFLKAKPDVIDLEVAEESISSITTNCDKIFVETESDTVRVTLDDRMVRILGIADGRYEILVVGIDITNNLTASAKITGTVTDTGVEPPPEPEPEPVEYYLTLTPEVTEMKAGESKLIKVDTNAPYWDPRMQDGDFFTYKKMSSSDVKITANRVGQGLLVIYASDDTGDVKEAVATIKALYNSANTEFIFDETSYEAVVLNETEIPFTSNITSVDEYEVTLSDPKVELIRKLESSIVVRPTYEAANQKFDLTVIAKKTTSDTHEYNETSVAIKIVVPDLVYSLTDVIRFPNEPDTEYPYAGGIWSEQVFYPPNPVVFRIYVHNEAVESGINFITTPYEDGTGVVISKSLGEVITTDTDPFVGFKPLDFMIKTGSADNYGDPSITTTYTVKPVVTVRGVPYERAITLVPEETTQLALSEYLVELEPFSDVGAPVQIITTANDIRVTCSNTNVCTVSYNEQPDGTKGMGIMPYLDGTAIITVEARDETGKVLIETCTVKVGTGEGSGQLARPLPGKPGFGVGMAPVELANKYNLKPVDKSGINDPTSPYFGLYKDEGENLMHFIPKLYFYRDNSDTVLNTYGDKLNGGKLGNDKWVLRASYTQEAGYFLHRAFINNGKEIEGIFVDRYPSGYQHNWDGTVPVSGSGSLGNRYNPVTTLDGYSVKNNGTLVTLGSNVTEPLWVDIPKARNEHSSWIDVYTNNLLFNIMTAEWHGQIMNGTSDSHPWATNVLHQPYPLIVDNRGGPYADMVAKYQLTLAGPSGEPYALPAYDISDTVHTSLFTHNGNACGIEFANSGALAAIGLLLDNKSVGTIINDKGENIVEIKTFKLTVDRSKVTSSNFLSDDLYDTMGIVIPLKEDGTNYTGETFYLDVMGNEDDGKQKSICYPNSTNINDDSYLFNSVGLPTYIEDYEANSHDNSGAGWGLDKMGVNDPRSRFLLSADTPRDPAVVYINGDYDKANVNYPDVMSPAIGDMYGYAQSLENWLFSSLRRVIIVPNEGTDLEISERSGVTYTTNKPLDYTYIYPNKNTNMLIEIKEDGTMKVYTSMDPAGPLFNITDDIEYINTERPKYKMKEYLDGGNITLNMYDQSGEWSYGSFGMGEENGKKVITYTKEGDISTLVNNGKSYVFGLGYAISVPTSSGGLDDIATQYSTSTIQVAVYFVENFGDSTGEVTQP